MGIQHSQGHKKRISVAPDNSQKLREEKKQKINLLARVGSEGVLIDKKNINFDANITYRNRGCPLAKKREQKKASKCFNTFANDNKKKSKKPNAETLIKYKSILSSSTREQFNEEVAKIPPALVKNQTTRCLLAKHPLTCRTNPGESPPPKVESNSPTLQNTKAYNYSTPESHNFPYYPAKSIFQQTQNKYLKCAISTIKSFCASSPFNSRYKKKQSEFSTTHSTLRNNVVFAAHHRIKSTPEEKQPILIKAPFADPLPNQMERVGKSKVINKKFLNKQSSLDTANSIRNILPRSMIASVRNSPKRKMRKANIPTPRISGISPLGNNLTPPLEKKSSRMNDLEHPPIIMLESPSESPSKKPPLKYRTTTEKPKKPLTEKQSPETTPSTNKASQFLRVPTKSQTSLALVTNTDPVSLISHELSHKYKRKVEKEKMKDQLIERHITVKEGIKSLAEKKRIWVGSKGTFDADMLNAWHFAMDK